MTTPVPQDPPTATDPHSPPSADPDTNAQPTVTVPSVTELLNCLDTARIAFEQATPTGHLRHQIEGYAARLHLAEQDLAQERRNHAGMSRGELDRLRKVEAALVELGAPNHSTHDDPGGPMIAWIRAQVAALEEVKAERDELAPPAAMNRLLETINDLGAPHGAHVDSATTWVRELVAERDKLTAELSRCRQYVASLVLAATASWPGWESAPDEVPAAVREAVREIKRLRTEATRALRSGSDALNNAATRMENRRRELVALLRNHPGGGLVHDPADWAETLNVIQAILLNRKLDNEFRTNLVQAVSRWVPAGEPVSDWQMLHLVGQLADQAARWFDAATEKPAATTASAPDPAGPVTFIDERGRAQTYTLDQVLDAVKHSDKGDGNNW